MYNENIPDQVVDDDGLRGHEKCMQALWDLRKLHSLSLKDLQHENENNNRINMSSLL